MERKVNSMGLVYAICESKDSTRKIINLTFPCSFEKDKIKTHVEKQHPNLKLVCIKDHQKE